MLANEFEKETNNDEINNASRELRLYVMKVVTQMRHFFQRAFSYVSRRLCI